MAAPLAVGLPPYITLGNNYVIQISATDPLTGNTVGGLEISSASIAVDARSAPPSGVIPPNPLLVPG